MKVIKDSDKQFINIIKNRFPDNEFPRELFPDLESTLITFIREKILQSKRENKYDHNSIELAGKICPQYLIQNSPGVLVMIYHHLIRRYLFRKMFNRDDIDDMLHRIIEILLEKKIEGIKRKFNFKDSYGPTFTSYFMVTIRNIYIDEIRKYKMKGAFLMENRDLESYSSRDSSLNTSQIIINEEIEKLITVFSLFRKSKEKLLTILKVLHSRGKDIRDAIQYLENCSEEDIRILNTDFSGLSEKIIFEKITPIFNKYELSPVKPDSLRRWTSVKLAEISRLMNKMNENNPYNSKNISDLISIFFNQYRSKRREKNVL